MSTKGNTKSTNLGNGLFLGFRSGAGVKNTHTLGNTSSNTKPTSPSSSTKPTSCHCAKCGGVSQPVNKPTNSKKEEVKNMSPVNNGLESIFRTNNASDTNVTTKEPPLPYPTKLHLAARICKAVESKAGRPNDATIQQMAALSDDTLIKLAVANNVQFILNHDGSINRRPDPWGIVKKDDFYDKYL